MSGIRTKHFWSEEEKRSICAQPTLPGCRLLGVARRYALNSTLIFKWLKDRRFVPGQDTEDCAMAFLPVEFGDIGVLVSFTGLVRASSTDLQALDLEHYGV